MKKILCLLVFLVVFSHSASAIIFVGASLPFSGEYDLKTSESFKSQSISGVGLNLVIPFGLMFRIDQLTSDAKKQGYDFSASSTIASLGYRFDMLFLPIHLAAAYGLATPSTTNKVPGVSSFDVDSQTQVYFELGYDILPLFDVFLGYHLLSSGKITQANNDGSKTDLSSSLSGSILSLGINFGF